LLTKCRKADAGQKSSPNVDGFYRVTGTGSNESPFVRTGKAKHSPSRNNGDLYREGTGCRLDIVGNAKVVIEDLVYEIQGERSLYMNFHQ
jgi:hypothetical protein